MRKSSKNYIWKTHCVLTALFTFFSVSKSVFSVALAYFYLFYAAYSSVTRRKARRRVQNVRWCSIIHHSIQKAGFIFHISRTDEAFQRTSCVLISFQVVYLRPIEPCSLCFFRSLQQSAFDTQRHHGNPQHRRRAQ